MEVALDRYLRVTPTDEETARAAVRPYKGLTPRAKLEALAALLREMDALLAGRRPRVAPDDAEFWRHWTDPARGRPR